MSRNNELRTGPRGDAGSEAPPSRMNPLGFIAPTDHVELPSHGKCYPAHHPLHNKETIEINYMTAKEEDILTSRSLLKKGLAIERLIDSLITDKTINGRDLIVGDRNAILIAARGAAYGNDYTTKVTCPNCGTVSKYEFDLEEAKVYNGDKWDDVEVEITPEGLYKTTLPVTQFEIEFRILNGKDELEMVKKAQKNQKHNMVESNISDQIKLFIVSVNGYSEAKVINHVVPKLPAKDSMYLRKVYKACAPDVRSATDFTCPACEFEQELEVPFGADFFWPDR